MYHKIIRVLSKKTDYKMCVKCKSVNWYENQTCWNCDSSKFRKRLDKSTINYLKEDIEAGEGEFLIQI